MGKKLYVGNLSYDVDDAALQPGHVPREDTQHHKAEMADARVRHQFLDIRLHHGDQGSVHDANNRQYSNSRGIHRRRIRKQRQAKTDESIAAHFEEHPRQNDAAGSRRFDVGIW